MSRHEYTEIPILHPTCSCWMCGHIDLIPVETKSLAFYVDNVDHDLDVGTVIIIADGIVCASPRFEACKNGDDVCLNRFLFKLPALKEFTSTLLTYNVWTGDPIRHTIDTKSIPKLVKINCSVEPNISASKKLKMRFLNNFYG